MATPVPTSEPLATGAPMPAPPRSRSWLWSLVLGLAILVVIGLVPLLNDPAALGLWTTIILFCVLAQSWNLIGGFAGYAAFGNVAFFGIGAYAVAVALVRNWPFWLGLAAGVVVAGVLAFLLGLPLLRLKGHYFAVATLGVAEALGEFTRAQSIGGQAGEVSLTPPSIGLFANTLFFYGFLALSLIMLVGTTWLSRSRLGYALVAIRENEQAAEALGIATFRYKVAAFTLSALPTALVGGLWAYWQLAFAPTGEGGAFDVNFSVSMVLMTFLGGAGTIVGPLIGGIMVEYLDNYTLTAFPSVHGPLLGGMIVLVTIFLPQGLVRLAQELFRVPVEGPEAARVGYIQRFGEGVRRVARFIASQGV